MNINEPRRPKNFSEALDILMEPRPPRAEVGTPEELAEFQRQMNLDAYEVKCIQANARHGLENTVFYPKPAHANEPGVVRWAVHNAKNFATVQDLARVPWVGPELAKHEGFMRDMAKEMPAAMIMGVSEMMRDDDQIVGSALKDKNSNNTLYSLVSDRLKQDPDLAAGWLEHLSTRRNAPQDLAAAWKTLPEALTEDPAFKQRVGDLHPAMPGVMANEQASMAPTTKRAPSLSSWRAGRELPAETKPSPTGPRFGG